MAVLCLFLFPTLVSVLSQLIRRRRLCVNATEIVSWCFFSLLFVSFTVPLFFPLKQLSIRAAHDGLPMFSCTGVVPAVLALAGIAGGLWFGSSRHELEFVSIHASGKNRIALFSVFAALVRLLLHVVLFVLILLTIAYFWAFPQFQNINLEELLFYLSMPLQGTAHGFTEGVVQYVVVPSLLCIFLIELAVWLPVRRRKKRLLRSVRTHHPCLSLIPLRLPLVPLLFLLITWGIILYICGDAYLDVSSFVSSRVHQSTLIRDEYADPAKVGIRFPEEKRNLICIYVESAETTSQDMANGGIFDVNYIPEMTELARENISFSQSELLQGATVAPACGWTMAGLVAETAGIPLKLYTYEGGTLGVDNMSKKFQYFLPGATTLGDILEDAGYRNVFLAGSDFVFGGRTLYYTQHGSYEIFDLLTAKDKGLIPPDYMVGWGFEDEKLYAYARDMLTELASDAQPFHLSMLTVDTHAPFYECRLCPSSIDDHCGKVLSCASAQLNEFIAWCSEQPFYENTTIVITGDHASIVGDFYDNVTGESLDIHHGSTSRLVYNAFINSAVQPVQEKNRRFTTMDFFPTTLASIGVSIEGDRLALGTNLFSDQQTLSEKYGYEFLFTELDKKSIFYNQALLYP